MATPPIAAVGGKVTAPDWNVLVDDLTDTGWIVPSLLNGWTVSGGFIVQYRLLNGIVHVRGRVAGGTAVGVFQLFSQYRPGGTNVVVAAVVDGGLTSTATTPVYVDTSGNVVAVVGTTPNLAGIPPFPAE